MPKDSKNTGYNTRSRRAAKERKEREKREQYRRHESSDSDSDDSSFCSEDELDEYGGLDMREYRKFLSKMFPSKYAKQRAEETPRTRRRVVSPRSTEPRKRRKTLAPRKEESDEEEEENVILETTDKKSETRDARKGKKRSKTEQEQEQEEEEEEEYVPEEEEDDDSVTLGDEDTEDEDDDEDAEEVEEQPNINVFVTIGGQHEGMEEDEEEEDEEEEEDDEDDKSMKDTDANRMAIQKMKKLLDSTIEEDGEDSPVVKTLKASIEKAEEEMQRNGKKKEKRERSSNAKKFNKLVKEKNMLNDAKYFKEQLSVKEQKKVLTELEAVMAHCHIEKPYRLQLLDADIPPEFKSVAYKKINTLKYMEPGGGEYYKIKQWVDTFMQIPFGHHKNLPVTLKQDGPEKCADFMDSAKSILDSAVYGMNDVKLQIMQMVGQWITNPSAMGTAIAIKGPMGTGKTTLVKEGISKVLGRDFAFMALGGATDSSFLEGHSYTYEGSTWGKIVDNLVQCKSMNPVIFFDELDKVSDTPKGEEIIGILTHLTDTSQNSKFHDKYFSEIDFDLSRCLFIFSYNDERKVNPILRDRMYRVQTKGYDAKEKIVIANQYLLPKIREQVRFEESDIVIPDETMKHIISIHTEGEQGVRNLKRCLEIIYTKLNLYRLMRPGTNLFEKEMALSVEFPMTITNEIVDKLIKTEKNDGAWRNMFI